MLTDHSKKLVICVDDFALHEGVNAAVFDLLELGRISAVSCMVDGASWVRDAGRLQALAGQPVGEGGHQADVGLHLNLTECLDPQAQASAPCHPLGALIRQAYARQLPAQALRAEVARQWHRFVQVWGRAPDFVDGHQHVHQLPQVRQVLLDVMAQEAPRHGSARPWVRICRSPGWRQVGQGVRWSDAAKAAVIGALGASVLAQKAAHLGFGVSQRLLGVYPFDADPRALSCRWRDWLAVAAARDDVLMCHPAKPGLAEEGVQDEIASARHVEYEFLTGPEWAERLRHARIRVARLQA